MRVASLLPGATDAVLALGAQAELVGVSHECDQDAVVHLPRLTRPLIDPAQPSAAIDAAVREAMAVGRPLYDLDADAFRRAAPELVITQQLCPVCAPDARMVEPALSALALKPALLSLHPHTLGEILNDLRTIGDALGRAEEGQRAAAALQARLQQIAELTQSTKRPRVFCLEWLKPPMACGHWVPEQVELAGGHEVLGRMGEPSRYVSWREIADAAPEVLVLMPCGFPIDRTRRELSLVTDEPLWRTLPAVRQGCVHLVNGPAYFNRSGPRLVDGVELLAGLIHPEAATSSCGQT